MLAISDPLTDNSESFVWLRCDDTVVTPITEVRLLLHASLTKDVKNLMFPSSIFFLIGKSIVRKIESIYIILCEKMKDLIC